VPGREGVRCTKHHAAVIGIGFALHQPVAFERVDQPGHRRPGDARLFGELGGGARLGAVFRLVEQLDPAP